MLSAALIAVGAVAYQSIPTPPIKPEPPIVIVEPLPPPPPPPKETYRDRTAKIKQSPWWLSETPPPAGNAEKAWLSETRALAAKNDMAARINLGLASLGRLVAGVDRGEAMKTLASGLMLADTQSLAGENAGVVKEGACKATLLALFVGDSAMEQAAAPAFAHLATLNNYDSALTAGHLYACKFTSAESGKAGEFYKMAAGAPDPKLREAAKLALTSLEAKSPMCHFEMPVPELKQKLQACGQP